MKVKLKLDVQFAKDVIYNVGDIIEVVEFSEELYDDLYFINNTNYVLAKKQCEIIEG